MSAVSTAPQSAAPARLVAFAKLPARTTAAGPKAGQFAGPGANGVALPLSHQPVQGISSVLPAPGGVLLALTDNGFGTKASSADYTLRIYRLRPRWKSRPGEAGRVEVLGSISLSDPQRKLGFPIVAEGTLYPNSAIPVDPRIRSGRLLTGADLDVESFREMPDGTFWLGDEIGPFLVHVDAAGRVLEPVVRVPNVLQNESGFIQSPDSPLLDGDRPNLPRSGGFEGMALMPDGETLYCLLEKPVEGDPYGRERLLILRFDTPTRRFAAEPIGYRREREEHAIGEMTGLNERELLVVERDDEQGAKARFKRVYAIDVTKTDERGFAGKRLVADLMSVSDPENLSGTGGGRYTMPFTNIETVALVDPSMLLVVQDNNFPTSNGRVPGQPEDTEFAWIELGEPLAAAPSLVAPSTRLPPRAARDRP